MSKDYEDCVKEALKKGRSLMLLEIQDIAFCSNEKARQFKAKIESQYPDLYVADGRNRSLVLEFDAANGNTKAKKRKCNCCGEDFDSEWAGNRRCKPCHYMITEKSGDGRLPDKFAYYT